jgi:hypothetical protein
MRAVSFFGAAAFCVTGSGAGVGPAAGVGAGAGLRGTVGRAPSVGGLGGVAPGNGLAAGGGTVGRDFGAGGGGTNGFGAVGGAPEPIVNFVVSFFGAGFPGTFIRTVSRFTAGCSLFGGSVMRIVSLLVKSSVDSDGAGGISSAIWRLEKLVARPMSCRRICCQPPNRFGNLQLNGFLSSPAKDRSSFGRPCESS